MKNFLLPLAVFSLALPAAAQDASPDDTRTVAWHNAQQSALHSRTEAEGWHQLEGGVMFRRIAGDGTGPAPAVGDEITIHYTGSFIDGEVFDSSVERGEPATFPLGRLVRGWQIAIPYMGVGDTAEIAIPADYAYEFDGRGPIPGGATLLFTIELLGIPSQEV